MDQFDHHLNKNDVKPILFSVMVGDTIFDILPTLFSHIKLNLTAQRIEPMLDIFFFYIFQETIGHITFSKCHGQSNSPTLLRPHAVFKNHIKWLLIKKRN